MTSLLDAPRAASVLGSRQPRILSVPDAASSSGQECVDLAAQAGLILDPWQQDVLLGAMGERADGTWAARDVAVVVGRQNGKNAILEARELAGLFLLNEQLLIHTAHQYKTAHEAFLRVRGLIEGHDEFRKRVKSILASPGKAEIIMRSGQRLMFVARGVNGSVRGFSPDLVVLDEAYRLPVDVQAAILPAISARPNPQLWYTSSAGFADSDVLRRLRERGVSRESRTLAYFEWSAPDGSALTDRAAWAQANPGYGIRLFDEAIESELESLDAPSFARERLGIWENEDGDGGFPAAAWSKLADPNCPRGERRVFAVATAPDRTWAAIAVAWRRDDGTDHVVLADYKPETTWIAARVSELVARWGGRVYVDTASRGLVPDAVGVGAGDQAIAHNMLADAALAGTVHHDDEAAMNVSARAARFRSSGDTQTLERKGHHDISPLAAAALAVWALRTSTFDVAEAVW